ncbi:TPA: hypothetical protein ACH3X2_007528 [Trebouxia sp. C0005]
MMSPKLLLTVISVFPIEFVNILVMLSINFAFCRCSMQPLDLASLQSGTSSLQDALRMQQGLAWKHSSQASINQLTRLTLHTEDSSVAAQAFTGAQAAAASYNLLAIEPLSDQVLQQACASLDVDIITFDLSKRLPFRFKPGPLQVALKRGLHLEICYASALREETARRNFFANALALTRATRGKGIVVSSSARSAFELRGPYDVINMATLFGLSEHDSKAALTTNCEAVIAHAQARKAYKGAVLIEAVRPAQDNIDQTSQAVQVPLAGPDTVSLQSPAKRKTLASNTSKQRKRKSR